VSTQDGFMEICNEILAAHATNGKTAGVPDGDVADLAECNARIARIDIFLPVYLKAAEILEETRAKLDDKRQRIVLNATKSVDRRAGQNPTLLAKYEKTRTYRSAIAKKGLKTKAKNASQVDANGGSAPTPEAPAASPTP
jgi:hypothetical protein